MKKKGFTLAEVLVTLGVIGVVSAMTLSTLIQNYQKQATANQLKKAYSEFSQALQKAEAEHGLMETWNFADGFDTAIERSTYFGENYIFPYLKTIKKCIPTSGECWADKIYNIDDLEITTSFSNASQKQCSLISLSGYSVLFWVSTSGTDAWYVVDINGPQKAPNKLGRDIFAFIISFYSSKYNMAGLDKMPVPKRNELIEGKYEDGNPIDSASYNCKKNNSGKRSYGAYCGAIIMLDGWKISDDYPW